MDAVNVIEVIPPNEVAYHAGDGLGNRTSIGVEICERNYAKSLANAAQFVAKMLHERGWGIERLRRHFDWSGKNCPRLMNSGGWSGWLTFKNMVQAELDELRRYKMDPKDANTIIQTWLGPAWNFSQSEVDKKELNRLANEVRKSAGLPTQ